METLNPAADAPETPADITLAPAPPAAPPVAPAQPVTPPAAPVAPAAPVLSAEEKLKADADMQALVNRLIGEARKEGRKSGEDNLLKTVGVDKPETIKALLDAERARQEAEMTEAQRLQAQIDALNAEKQAALEQASATQEQMRKTLINAEIDKQARALKFIDPFDLQSRLDSAAIEVDLETGVVTGVDVQAKSIAAKAKHLIEQATPQNPSPQTPPPASARTQATATDEERRRKAWKPR